MSSLTTESIDPPAAGGRDVEQLQLVSFEVGNEQFGIDILVVQEINRVQQITRVPQSPPCVKGVINLRGRIVPVVDLRQRLGLETTDYTSASRIIVVEEDARIIGFIVDKVNEVLRINTSIVDPAPDIVGNVTGDYIKGVGKLEDRLLILLDLSRLLDAQELSQIDRVVNDATSSQDAGE